jgi:hypothetical protein
MEWLVQQEAALEPRTPAEKEALTALAREMAAEQQTHDVLVRDLEAQAGALKAERERVAAVLAGVGWSGPVPPACSALASAATTLKLRNTDAALFSVGLAEWHTKLAAANAQLALQMRTSAELVEHTQLARQEMSTLQQLKTRFDDELATKRETDAKLAQKEETWQQKCTQYTQQKEDLSEKLASSGVGKDVTHSALVDAHQRVEATRAQAAALREQLDTYHNLPPDTTAAMHCIQETRAKLARLEQEFNDGITNMQVIDS